jgi:chromosome segregation ATPase
MSGESDIVERLRSPNASGADWRRLYGEAADEIERLRYEVSRTDLALLEAKGKLSALEIERLRKVRHDAGSLEDQLAKARLKIEQQANRIDALEAEVTWLRTVAAAAIKVREPRP